MFEIDIIIDGRPIETISIADEAEIYGIAKVCFTVYKEACLRWKYTSDIDKEWFLLLPSDLENNRKQSLSWEYSSDIDGVWYILSSDLEIA